MARSLDARITTGDIPPALQGVLLDFRWRLDRLLALDLPVEEVSIGDLTWLLDLPFWQENGEWFVLTPNDVRERPQEHREQWSRTSRADLDAPVHVAERRGRLVIIDGIHRLLKADIVGRRTLPARRLPTALFPLIAARRGMDRRLGLVLEDGARDRRSWLEPPSGRARRWPGGISGANDTFPPPGVGPSFQVGPDQSRINVGHRRTS